MFKACVQKLIYLRRAVSGDREESDLFSLYELTRLLFPPSGLATSHMLHNYGKLNFACTSDTAAAVLPY